LMSLLIFSGCKPPPADTTVPFAPQEESKPAGDASAAPMPEEEHEPTLPEARRGFKTKLIRRETDGSPVDKPPQGMFRRLRYESPAGKLAAYLSPDPGDGRKHPAIIWIFGGFSNGIGATAWEEQPAKNDQSASAFRKAGIIMMHPSFRGGHDNPGVKEGFFGEVDDVLAARDYLAKQEYVDPERIYLGGHSTGGTLALLVAECSDKFRAVFSFGPVDDVTNYGAKRVPFDIDNKREAALRAPERWLHSIHCPTFVFEGRGGNIDSLEHMARSSDNHNLHFFPIDGADHFSILAPASQLIASKILRDDGAATNIRFSAGELRKLAGK
jgi:alpha/beta superfamily hydrolase